MGKTIDAETFLSWLNEAEEDWLDRQYGYLEWDRYSNGHGGCSLYRVAAWMPIPNLYKG